MLGAIALNLYKLYAVTHQESLSPTINTLFQIGSVALVAHIVEGIWAAAIASRQGDPVLKTGIYTFFTGFIGLSETLESARLQADHELS